jgi:hypothetical protein
MLVKMEVLEAEAEAMEPLLELERLVKETMEGLEQQVEVAVAAVVQAK